jgi:hypothetical protein
MTEKKSTYSDTIAVKREELEAMRNMLTNVSAATLLSATHSVKHALDRMIDAEKCRAQRTASYANENDKPRAIEPHVATKAAEKWLAEQPTMSLAQKAEAFTATSRTMKGETMSEQTTRLKFRPALINLSERKHSHYFKDVSRLNSVDVYRVLSLFSVTDQALGHAIKKLLVAGGRGAGKDIGQDIQEAIDTLQRWQEMREEDAAA